MINRQNNVYTVCYAALLVIVVGLALSLIYQALRPMQQENIANDTRRQILAAALISPDEQHPVSLLYKEHIKDSFIVDANGQRVDSGMDPSDVNVAEQSKVAPDKRILPVFLCSTDHGDKYILPVYGAGLWGPIWGYVAFDSNGETIYGAYFAHQGETPGLGAEIEKPAFSSQFEGKNVFNDEGKFTSVAVSKVGHAPTDGTPYVDAISGGTVTSTGVQKMLFDSLEPYTVFLRHLAVDTALDNIK